VMLSGATLSFALATALTLAQGAPLPGDARLDPVRARLEALVSGAARDGLPAEVLVSKVREGLAKGVPADRIETATSRLADSLKAAQGFVRERRPGTPTAVDLVRALAEARLAGVELQAVDPMVRGRQSGTETARAVEVLTDLTLRGYPTSRAAGLVQDLLARDAAALARLPATLDVLRREQALTHAETVDALARNLRGNGNLDGAARGAAAEAHAKAGGRGKAPGSPAGPGNDAFIPPGQLKKQSGGKGRGPKK
jgi:hypothetical protein